MAKQLIEYPTRDGSTVVLAEITVEDGDLAPVSRNGVAARAKQNFEDAVGVIRPIANMVIEGIGDLAKAPDEINVEFGVKLGGKLGAFIASAETEATIKVSLTWKKESKSG